MHIRSDSVFECGAHFCQSCLARSAARTAPTAWSATLKIGIGDDFGTFGDMAVTSQKNLMIAT